MSGIAAVLDRHVHSKQGRGLESSRISPRDRHYPVGPEISNVRGARPHARTSAGRLLSRGSAVWTAGIHGIGPSGTKRTMLILKKLRSFGLAVLFVGLFVPHGSHAQKVTTEWAKGFNFGELKRFAWRKNNLVTVRNPEDNKFLDQKIMRVVTQELASKGIVEDSSDPDFYLFYHAGPGDEGLQVAAAPPEGLDSIQPP